MRVPTVIHLNRFRELIMEDIGVEVPDVLTFKVNDLVELMNVPLNRRFFGPLSPLVENAIVNIQYGLALGTEAIIVKYSYLIDFADKHGDDERVVTKIVYPGGEVQVA